jgi:hypothetical protein
MRMSCWQLLLWCLRNLSLDVLCRQIFTLDHLLDMFWRRFLADGLDLNYYLPLGALLRLTNLRNLDHLLNCLD